MPNVLKIMRIAILSFVIFAIPDIALYGQGTVRAGKENTGKPFTITASVREEYDDNINTSPDDEVGSFKTIVSPGILFNYPMENTTFSAGYVFGLTYYMNRPGDGIDYSHDFTGRINHKFSPNFELDFREKYRYSQEPQVGNGVVIQRRLGDGYVNIVSLDGTYVWTDRFSTVTGYSNTLRSYKDEEIKHNNDYDMNRASQDFRFQLWEPTTLVLNYSFESFDYGYINRSRDTHFFLGGFDHYLLPEWLFSSRAGVELSYYENPEVSNGTNPYVSLNTTWNYLPRSELKAGYVYSTTVTDDENYASQQSHQLSLGILHAFTPKFKLGGDVSYIMSQMGNDVSLNNSATIDEDTFSVSARAIYDITDYLSVNAGYRYSSVVSGDDTRDYWRNQVYFGVTGRY